MYDYHSHSSFSDDCQVSMKNMIEGAIAKGIKELAITDHFDPGYPDPNFPFLLNFPAYHKELNNMSKEYREQIKIIKGIEIGIMDSQLNACTKAVNAFNYDFVIGSFHCIKNEDFYSHDYSQDNKEKKLIEFYTYMNTVLKTYEDYDVIGHFSILDRYLGEKVSYKNIFDIIEDTLKNIIYKGKGLELNTSSFRYNMDLWLPRIEILSLYKDLGGEVITIGSDAHSPSYFLDHFEEGLSMLKQLGFKYISTFDKRNIIMNKL